MNWKDRIARAEKRFKAKEAKIFTEEDIELASLWTTSPISEIADKVELKGGKLKLGPIDIYLVLDGIYFTKGVEEHNFGLAKFCYENIVKQAAALEARTDRITMLKQFLKAKYEDYK